jgi:hypothetical protein
MAARPVGPQYVSVDEYDALVFPGFLRRSVRFQRAVHCVARARGAPGHTTLVDGYPASCALRRRHTQWRPALVQPPAASTVLLGLRRWSHAA